MKPEDFRASATRPFTGEEYLASLRDDREIYIYGDRVKDVTSHPAFRNAAASMAGSTTPCTIRRARKSSAGRPIPATAAIPTSSSATRAAPTNCASSATPSPSGRG